jgi:tRNA (guanine-N7-)-methyltransferase
MPLRPDRTGTGDSFRGEEMAKKKLRRFAELTTFANVFQTLIDLKGKWRSDYFHNDHPIVLELACGKGEYTVALAHRFPEKNFIGVDIKGARLWCGARTAIDEGLQNVGFLRIPIETIDNWFAPDEIDEIWITFPDPFLREGKARKRLTSPRFLALYRQMLRADGVIHLKTDEPNLFAYTQAVAAVEKCVLLEIIEDVYHSDRRDETLSIQTTYERKHLEVGRTIRYLRFRFGP